jgi:hypothetical protein
MIQGRYTRIDFRESQKLKERIQEMIIGKKDEQKIVVTIKTAQRDNREKVDGEKNKQFGKIVYETVESIDVYDAKPEDVVTAVNMGLESAAEKRPAKK